MANSPSTENATRLNEIHAAMRALDNQLNALKEQRQKLHNERCALEWGFAVGDTIKHRTKGTKGIVYDFETHWPRIYKLRKNGTAAAWPTNAYHPQEWEKA